MKILTRLAQTQTPTETPEPTVAGAPVAFRASGFYPTLNTGWGADNAKYIDNLTNLLNTTLYYTSNGEVQMNSGQNALAPTNFQMDASKYPDPLRKLILFCKVVFKELFNSRNDFKQELSDEDKKLRVSLVKGDSSLNNLPAVNLGGQLSTKIPGNIKTLIITELDKIH